MECRGGVYYSQLSKTEPMHQTTARATSSAGRQRGHVGEGMIFSEFSNDGLLPARETYETPDPQNRKLDLGIYGTCKHQQTVGRCCKFREFQVAAFDSEGHDGRASSGHYLARGLRSTLAAAYASIGALPLRNSGQRRMVLLLLVLVSCAALRAVRTDAQETLPSSASPQGATLKSLIGSRHVLLRYWHDIAKSKSQCHVGGFVWEQVLPLSRRGMHRVSWTRWCARRPSADRCHCTGRQPQYVQLSEPRYAKWRPGGKHAGYCLPIESKESCKAVFILYCSATA